MGADNLLLVNGRVHVIDLGQAVDTHHPNARELLARDLSTVAAFFTKQRGVASVHPLPVLERFVTDKAAFESAASFATASTPAGAGDGEGREDDAGAPWDMMMDFEESAVAAALDRMADKEVGR